MSLGNATTRQEIAAGCRRRLDHQLVPIRHKGTSDWAYSWVPVLGPLLGALLAADLYALAPPT